MINKPLAVSFPVAATEVGVTTSFATREVAEMAFAEMAEVIRFPLTTVSDAMLRARELLPILMMTKFPAWRVVK